jgi:hypothetical protein
LEKVGAVKLEPRDPGWLLGKWRGQRGTDPDREARRQLRAGMRVQLCIECPQILVG